MNWVAPYDRLLPLGERPTQFRQGDILHLPDPLPGHSEFLSKRDELSELLEVLNDREREIIFKRFGLDGGKPKTLEEANSVESSSPIGASNDAGRIETVFN